MDPPVFVSLNAGAFTQVLGVSFTANRLRLRDR